MEAVGRLAGGIAHDFNNLLTAILGYSELALLKIGVDDPLHGDLDEIRLAAGRATTLTGQLLTFSRKRVVVPRVVDLGTVVSELSTMLRRLISADVELVTAVQPGSVNVKADRGQIEQVLMNLSLNGRDAMPQGGRLSIEVKAVQLDEACGQQHLEVLPGEYVMLAVTDTGISCRSRSRSGV